MPELPEVETVKRELAGFLIGKTILKAQTFGPGLRKPFQPELTENLKNYKIKDISRRGKYLVFSSSNNRPYLLAHLGMSGKMLVFDRSSWKGRQKHDHFIMKTEDSHVVTLNDPRRFGLILLMNDPYSYPGIASLGPEPLEESFTGKVLLSNLSKTSQPIKIAIMDQRIVAGIGNIYACEALYMSGISPEKPAKTLTPSETDKLATSIKEILTKAIEAGGSTLRDYARTSGETGYFQFNFSVYGKEGEKCPCCTCNTSKTGGINKIRQAGRSTFFCPEKQRNN